MPVVEDKQENMERCKKFCGTCPTFKRTTWKEAPPYAVHSSVHRGWAEDVEKASRAKDGILMDAVLSPHRN